MEMYLLLWSREQRYAPSQGSGVDPFLPILATLGFTWLVAAGLPSVPPSVFTWLSLHVSLCPLHSSKGHSCQI